MNFGVVNLPRERFSMPKEGGGEVTFSLLFCSPPPIPPRDSRACGNVGNLVSRKRFSKAVGNTSHASVFHSRHFHKPSPTAR